MEREDPLHRTSNKLYVILSEALAKSKDLAVGAFIYASLDSGASLGMTYKVGYLLTLSLFLRLVDFGQNL